MFEGFRLEHIEVGPVTLRVRYGGSGPAVVLLHGHPRTHATWHRVAPLLSRRFTVVCPDLRGYGGSSKPDIAPDHAPHAKRAMANDIVALMNALGHNKFAIVGHDRGAYVAFRAAMDHPDAVTHLCVLDAVPIGEALARCDARFASRWWHWFFLGQTAKPAERVISADPDAWYAGNPDRMGRQAWRDYQRAIHDPATVQAMCEDYRAGLTVDRAHDDADRAAGRTVACPVHVIWSVRDDLAELYGDPVAVWRTWAHEVSGEQIDSGHHMAEEAPQELAAALTRFLKAPGRTKGQARQAQPAQSASAFPPVHTVPVTVEVLLFSTDGSRLRYEPLQAQLSAGQEPEVTAQRLCGIEETGDGLLHSTSWRFEQGAVVLTYAALRHASAGNGNGRPAPAATEVATGTDESAPAPDDLDLDEVAIHACRHLAFLVATDPAIAQALEGFPVIRRLIRRYTPDVAGRIWPDNDDR